MVNIFVNTLQLFFFFLTKWVTQSLTRDLPLPNLHFTSEPCPNRLTSNKLQIDAALILDQTANWCCKLNYYVAVLQCSSSKPNCLLSNSLSYEGCWRTEIYTDYCKSYLNNSQLAMILDQITSSILTVNSPLFSLLPSQ